MMARNCDSRAGVTALSLILLCLTISNNIVPVAEAIWLSIPNSGTKCVSEEIQNDVVVLADYYVLNEEHPEHPATVTVRVTSPYGNNLHHNENATHGQFAFTTSEGGNYLACFTLDGHQEPATGVTLSLDWKTGIAAKDWDSVAKKEKIEGVELEVRKLKDHAEAIHNNLLYLKPGHFQVSNHERAQNYMNYQMNMGEADMREVSEKTNSRVAWFSIMSLGVCIVVSVLQLWHLKRYFQKKKLI